MAILALNTGMRLGELLALHWEDVDLVTGRIVVRRNIGDEKIEGIFVMRGVPLKIVSDLLGHSTTGVTERYAHLTPGVTRDAVDCLLEGQIKIQNPTSSDTEATK